MCSNLCCIRHWNSVIDLEAVVPGVSSNKAEAETLKEIEWEIEDKKTAVRETQTGLLSNVNSVSLTYITLHKKVRCILHSIHDPISPRVCPSVSPTSTDCLLWPVLQQMQYILSNNQHRTGTTLLEWTHAVALEDGAGGS